MKTMLFTAVCLLVSLLVNVLNAAQANAAGSCKVETKNGASEILVVQPDGKTRSMTVGEIYKAIARDPALIPELKKARILLESRSGAIVNYGISTPALPGTGTADCTRANKQRFSRIECREQDLKRAGGPFDVALGLSAPAVIETDGDGAGLRAILTKACAGVSLLPTDDAKSAVVDANPAPAPVAKPVASVPRPPPKPVVPPKEVVVTPPAPAVVAKSDEIPKTFDTKDLASNCTVKVDGVSAFIVGADGKPPKLSQVYNAMIKEGALAAEIAKRTITISENGKVIHPQPAPSRPTLGPKDPSCPTHPELTGYQCRWFQMHALKMSLDAETKISAPVGQKQELTELAAKMCTTAPAASGDGGGKVVPLMHKAPTVVN